MVWLSNFDQSVLQHNHTSKQRHMHRELFSGFLVILKNPEDSKVIRKCTTLTDSFIVRECCSVIEKPKLARSTEI